MRIICTSDLHGELPKIPKCDLLVIGGDICPDFMSAWAGPAASAADQYAWLDTAFREWLEYIPAACVVATWGNHDHVGAHQGPPPGLRCQFLVDEETLVDCPDADRPLRIYGTPWSLPYGRGWAFMRHDLEPLWERIPEGLDILIVHGPPDLLGDRVLIPPGKHVGSVSLRERIQAVRPKLVVTGHIHEAFGRYISPTEPRSVVLNASLMDEDYCPLNPLWEAIFWQGELKATGECNGASG